MASLPLSPPSDRRTMVLAGVVIGAAILSAGLLWALLDRAIATALLLSVGLALVAVIGIILATRRPAAAPLAPITDWPLLADLIEDTREAVALTTRDGRLVAASAAYRALSPGLDDPARLGLDDGEAVARSAWRDGMAEALGITIDTALHDLAVRRAGEDHLVWRFRRSRVRNAAEFARALIEGVGGVQLGSAGVMAVLVDAEGRVAAANALFVRRALGEDAARPRDVSLTELIAAGDDGGIRLAREAGEGDPLRLISVPLEGAPGLAIFLLLDQPDGDDGIRGTATEHVHGLLAMLPLGLALTERDGRFLFMNEAFGRAAGVEPGDPVLYPGDLVVDEDKATVSDAVRRFAAGRALPGDLAIRLHHRPEEPVALTIAGAKGLGDAAVLLSLKDNSEESKLKRQVAQATKMQAVGQLAGGVAHDFNNILTAIIGHCDLMMMRHTPGDSDYDDIQQIRNNSNRAAGLTRQLLAFSRQQTLRPQILQLPDVIAETSSLLKRLMGETIKFTVKHGRNLGAVRADPGQLEQVIMNLAVNARDAMPDGGTLTIRTYPVSAAEVRRMASDIMPVGDYTAMKVSDTGHGIPDAIIAKIFEPFFTTKEVGKGTGLGLSTVYGIVKQTDGFIFADSPEGGGTSFTIYLPVHQAAPPVQGPVRIEPAGEIWGTGTILLVEDEAMVRAVAERALERQGYTILTATNGEEALELLESHTAGGGQVDLLISDVVMPTMDGPTLVRHARERFPELPILFMSGYAEEHLRKSIDLDRIAFLPKPFSVQQLGMAAREALATPLLPGRGEMAGAA